MPVIASPRPPGPQLPFRSTPVPSSSHPGTPSWDPSLARGRPQHKPASIRSSEVARGHLAFRTLSLPPPQTPQLLAAVICPPLPLKTSPSSPSSSQRHFCHSPASSGPGPGPRNSAPPCPLSGPAPEPRSRCSFPGEPQAPAAPGAPVHLGPSPGPEGPCPLQGSGPQYSPRDPQCSCSSCSVEPHTLWLHLSPGSMWSGPPMPGPHSGRGDHKGTLQAVTGSGPGLRGVVLSWAAVLPDSLQVGVPEKGLAPGEGAWKQPWPRPEPSALQSSKPGPSPSTPGEGRTPPSLLEP